MANEYLWLLLEITAALFSLGCVFLAAKNHILNWPVSLIATSLYCAVFYHNRFYSEAYLQVVFCGMQIYGWIQWTKQRATDVASKITNLSLKQGTILGIVMIIAYIIWLTIYPKYYPSARFPAVDAALTVGSLTAIFMQSKRWIENWYVWIVLDVIYIPMFYKGNQPITAILYCIFVVLAYYGLTEWKQKKAL